MAIEPLEIPGAIVETALALELDGGDVVADLVEGRDCIFLAGLHCAEQSTAAARGPLPWLATNGDKAIPWVEDKTKLTLAGSPSSAAPDQLSPLLNGRP